MTAIATMPTITPRTTLRITRRGRRVLAAVIALPLAAALSWSVLGETGASASRASGAPAGTFTTITVAPGDSLWSIAQSVAPTADPRDVVYELMQLNALGSSVVEVGDRLAIPLSFSQ